MTESSPPPAGPGAASGPSLGDVISCVALVVGLITAWLYVAGWTHAYYYFDRFRIPMLMLDLPREHLFVYGGLTVWKNSLAAVLITAVAIALVWLSVKFRRVLGRAVLAGVAVFGIVALFGLARLAGIETARNEFVEQRLSDYRAYPRVELTLTDALTQESPPAGDASKVARSGCARLLLFSDDRVFFIRPIKDAPAAELHAFVLPWSAVKDMRIRHEYWSCE